MGQAKQRGDFTERKNQAVASGRIKRGPVGRVKVPFSALALGSFFIESPAFFKIHSGLPVGAKLVDIAFYQDKGYAVFEHDSFPIMDTVPERQVEWVMGIIKEESES